MAAPVPIASPSTIPNSIPNLLTTSPMVIFQPNGKGTWKVTNIKFSPINQITPYQITYSISWNYGKFTAQICSISLDAGDWVNDDGSYELSPGMSIVAYSNTSNLVSFVVMAKESLE